LTVDRESLEINDASRALIIDYCALHQNKVELAGILRENLEKTDKEEKLLELTAVKTKRRRLSTKTETAFGAKLQLKDEEDDLFQTEWEELRQLHQVSIPSNSQGKIAEATAQYFELI
jgi:hypothetical protein